MVIFSSLYAKNIMQIVSTRFNNKALLLDGLRDLTPSQNYFFLEFFFMF